MPPLHPSPTDLPAPAALGRCVVVTDPDRIPASLAGAPTYVVDEAVLEQPGPLAGALHHHWARREAFAVVLRVEAAVLQQREVDGRPPWELGPWFGFERERLHHRVWANSWDLRGDTPIWWRGVLAARHTPAEPAPPGAAGDVVLPDGTPAWIDGGPRGPVPGLPPEAVLVHRESIELLADRPLTRVGRAATDEPLDEGQRGAVDHPTAPARVLAPAGSGKTRTLVARTRHLLAERGIEAGLLTAVAYNRRAADELVERVGDRRVHVRTVHALARRICADAGISGVLDERGVREVLDRLVRVQRVPNTDPYAVWIDALAEVRIGLRSPAAVADELEGVDDLAEVLPRFREELARRGALDFDEMVVRAIELLCTDPDLRDAWRARCTHLLVDEFQDVTPAFVLLLRLLAWPDLQVVAVGDDDQVIYGHAGADPAFLLDVDLLLPGAADLRLATNYRCPPDVVDGAVTLLGHNRRRVAKRIESGSGRAPGLGIHRVPEVDAAAVVVDRIRDLVDAGSAPHDIAVLARVNSALLPFQIRLGVAGIPSDAPLAVSVLQRTGVRAALAYLRLTDDPEAMRREDLVQVHNRPSRQLSVLRDHLRRRNRWSIDDVAAIGSDLTDRQADRLDDLVADLRHLAGRRARGDSTAELLAAVRHDVGLGDAMAQLDGAGRASSGSSHGDDLTALQQVAELHPVPTGFDLWLREALERPATPGGVTLSSVHRVKGMEWDHVLVAPVSDGLMPHRLAENAEEERRVMHVAVTRGRRSVDVVAVRGRAGPYPDEIVTAADDPGGDPHGDLTALAELPLPDVVAARPLGDDGALVAVGTRLRLAGGVEAVVDELRPYDRSCVVGLLDGGRRSAARLRLPTVGCTGAEATVAVLDGVAGPRQLHVVDPAAKRRPTATSGAASGRLPGTGGSGRDSDEDDPLDPQDAALFEALRTWRAGEARQRGAPAYTVLNDRTLRAVARTRPRDEGALARIHGIGPTKLELFGDQILTIVADADD